MALKLSLARSVKVTVPSGKSVEQGKFYLIEGFLGVAVRSASEGEQVVLDIEQGVYETDQINTSEAFNKGDLVYWDDQNECFTTTENNRLAGRVVTAKDANNVVEILLGPQV